MSIYNTAFDTNGHSCRIEIQDIKQRIPVYFKIDGERFQYPYTVKMLTGSVLRFILTFKRFDSHIR